MKKSGWRTRRVAELIKEELGRQFIQRFQDATTGLITITRVEITSDFQTALVFLSVFGSVSREDLLTRLEKEKKILRRILASRINLKYNPQLIFRLEPGPEYEERIDRLIDRTKKSDNGNTRSNC